MQNQAPTQSELLNKMKVIKKLKQTNSRVYISGPISGYPDLNAPAFEQAEQLLKDNNLVPVNPLKIIDFSKINPPLTPEQEWVYAMKADIKEMIGCGALIMLDKWDKSKGAVWEFLNAKTLKIPVFTHNFELINLTKVEYVELYLKITELMATNDQSIVEEYVLKN